MTVWIIEPRDPLIVRDGRPFGPDPGARAMTLPFPFPSTIAGGLRGLAGRTSEQSFNTSLKDDVLQRICVRGPLLVAIDHNSQLSWFAPAPGDAAIHQTQPFDEHTGTFVSYIPATLPEGVLADTMTSFLSQAGISDHHKEHPKAPRFWSWHHFEQWLQNEKPAVVDLFEQGIEKLSQSVRSHVKIQAPTQTAEEGFLYQTRGLEFSTRERMRLALAAKVEVQPGDKPLFTHFARGVAPLGGERHLMHWASHADMQFPKAPANLFKDIARQKACRLILLTPAYFENGAMPDPLKLSHMPGSPTLLANEAFTLTISAAAIARSQVVSGWDMLHENKDKSLGAPKRTRLLAPAGVVYFLRIASNNEELIAKWAEHMWMRCISDDAQCQRDGFGLVALGLWDGTTKQIGKE